MANTSLKDDQDKKLNPGQTDYEGKVNNNAYTSSGIDQLEAYANDPNNSSDKSLKEREEESGRDGFYNPNTPKKANLSGNLNLKKKGPLSLIIAIVLGGGGLMTVLFSPAMGLVHMKEMFTNDLNDQLAALDVRGNSVMKARLKGMTTAGCTIRVKCKFTSMSNRQIRKFERAGFKVETNGKVFGRNRVAALVGPDSNRYTASNFRSAVRNDMSLRRSFNKAFRPAYLGFSDKVFNKVLTDRFKTNKASKLNSTSKETMSRNMRSVTAGMTVGVEDSRFTVNDDGKGVYTDSNGNSHVEGISDEYDKAKESHDRVKARANATGAGNALKNVGKGAAKGVGVLGVVDSACVVYNMSKMVASAAKIARATQLAQYSMVFLTTADKIKAGTATPEEVEYLGEILNSKDMRETVADESLENADSDGWVQVENKFYGKNAFDSPGYKLAAYGDVPNLSGQSQQFMLGAGVSGSLLKMVDQAKNVASDETCNVVTHPVTRVGSAAVGIVLAVGSFGTSTVILGTLSVGISVAIPFLEAYLADILSGTTVDENTKGVEAGDAVFSGTAAVMSGASQARGLKPLTTSEVESYVGLTNQVKSEHEAIARYEARETPFDVMNQYSFLGSLARIAYPMASNTSSGLTGFMAAIPKFLASPITSTTSSVNASSYNPERFNKCADEGYENLGIAADVFCNVRYGLTKTELAMDTEEVVDFMVGTHINGDTGEVVPGSAYEKFLENCVNREIGLGDTTEEFTSDGSECMKTDSQTNNFRVYTVDSSIADAMDDDDLEELFDVPDTPVASVPTGNSQEIAKIIRDNPNIKDNTSAGQINRMANGEKYVSSKVLQAIAAVGENNKFSISSAKRPVINVGAGRNSWHVTGDAIDLSGQAGVNGVKIEKYSSVNSTISKFLKELSDAVKATKPTSCQIGVPNNTYKNELQKTSSCYVFVDIGSAPHIHIGVR